MKAKAAALPTFDEHRQWALIGSIAFFIAGYIFSLWYLDAHHYGDTTFYRRFYDALYLKPIRTWSVLQGIHLGSAEPLYAYLIGIAASFGVDRVAYLSIWNALLIGSLGYVLLKYRCSMIFAALLMTNYYLIVILGPAERLKFAYLCLVLAFAVDNVRLRFVLSAASIFFHTQALIQFVSAAGLWVASNLNELAKHPIRTGFFAVIGGAVSAVVLVAFYNSVGQSIATKSEIYMAESGGLMEAIQWAMLLGAGLFVFRQKLAYFVAMMPMSLPTILFGNRVNVATLSLFVAVAMVEGKTRNPVVLAVMAYMSFKSIEFMENVLKYGTGYI